MLWRDGDRMIYQSTDDWICAEILLSAKTNLENKIRKCIAVDVTLGFSTVSFATYYNQLNLIEKCYQSFLLDYIEYLIETAIDEQLVEEELDRQCVEKIDWTVWNPEHLCRIFTYA